MMPVDSVLDVKWSVIRMNDEASVPRLPATTTADGGRAHHVLVVDDEPAILEIFREMLADEGCRVTCLVAPPCPQEILRLAPDAIVLDLVFGGRKTGLDLLRVIRAQPGLLPVPIIVCTALFDPRLTATLAAFEAPISLLTKPFDLDDAVAVIRSALAPSVAGDSA